MSVPTISPEHLARWALYGLHAGPPQADDRILRAVALAGRIHQSIGTLRELDLTGIAPASVFRTTDSVETALREPSDATL